MLRLQTIALGWPLAVFVACSSGTFGETPTTPTSGSVAPGGRSRLPLGTTFYFPKGVLVRLESSPDGNQNVPFTDETSGHMAFVPHVPGTHRFVDVRTDDAIVLEAIRSEGSAFHNVNYFP